MCIVVMESMIVDAFSPEESRLKKPRALPQPAVLNSEALHLPSETGTSTLSFATKFKNCADMRNYHCKTMISMGTHREDLTPL